MAYRSEEYLEVVSAFVDGEPVDAAALVQSLAEPDGRAYLVDILRLRRIARALPLTRAVPVSFRHPVLRAVLAWTIPAVVATAFITAFLAHRPQAPEVRVQQEDVLRDESTQRRSVALAPSPTVVVDLKPGETWFERAQVR